MDYSRYERIKMDRLKCDKKRGGDSGDDLMARTSPDPGAGSPVELSGSDTRGLLNLVRVGKALSRLWLGFAEQSERTPLTISFALHLKDSHR